MNPRSEMPARYALLLVLSLAVITLLRAMHLPASLLIGSTIAAIVMAVRGRTVTLSPTLFAVAQALLGCMMAQALPSDLFVELAHRPLFFVSASASVIVAATLLGALLAKWRVLPGTAGLWGAFPGGATAMVVMAEDYGADPRIVAFMQYLRVLLVALAGAIIARLVSASAATAPTPPWFTPIDPAHLAVTAAVVAGGLLAARRFKFAAGALLIPMAVSAAIQNLAHVPVEVPLWLLALGYMMIGWNIGMRFDREILQYVAKAAPRIMTAILTLIALCGGMSWLLSRMSGVDALTAYLAMSPGGADSVAIIAAASHVDLPFVMAVQTGRFLLVICFGPWIARTAVSFLKQADA